jgi:hypothetical protein
LAFDHTRGVIRAVVYEQQLESELGSYRLQTPQQRCNVLAFVARRHDDGHIEVAPRAWIKDARGSTSYWQVTEH